MNQLKVWRLVGIVSSALLIVTLIVGSLLVWQNNRDIVVAKVGEHNIYYSEWLEELQQQNGRQVVDQLIDQYVITSTAEQLGIEVTDAQVQQEIARMQQEYVSEEEFLTVIGLTKEELERNVRHQLLLEAIAIHDVHISDTEAEQYYEDNIDHFTDRAAIYLHKITVDTRAEANRIIEEIRNGAEFAAIAQEQSTDFLSAANGGEIGWVTYEDPSVEVNIFEVADELSLGEISEPIPVYEGYAIIKVEDRRERHVQPFANVKDTIRRELALAQVDSLSNVLAKLKQEKGIKIHKMFVEDAE